MTEAAAPDEGEIRRVRALVEVHSRHHGGRRFINKNTRNSRHVRYLHAIFPDAFFVHVIRDPRAVFAFLLAVSW